MKVIHHRTGATAVAVPSKSIIIVDPDAGRDTSVGAIRAILPDADPEAVQGWVEESIPTEMLTPIRRPALSSVPGRRRRSRPRPLTRGAARAIGRRVAAIAAAIATGAGGMATLHHTMAPTELAYAEPKPTLAPKPATRPTPSTMVPAVFESPTFSQIKTASGWSCRVGDLEADCAATDGIKLHVEALMGPYSVTFIFTYTTRPAGNPERAVLKVFGQEAEKRKFLTQIPRDQKMYDNLAAGQLWVLYGSDRKRLGRWVNRAGGTFVEPSNRRQDKGRTTNR